VAEVTERFKFGTIQKVLQNLLREEVPVHDLETILEAISDWPGDSEDAHFLTEHVRGSLARTLSQKYCSSDGKLWCVSLSPELEDEIRSHVEPSSRGEVVGMDQDLSERIAGWLDGGVAGLRREGRQGVVLCSPSVRRAVRQLVTSAGSEAAVLAYNEIDSVEVQTLSCVGMES
jgi:flagellar biosynthesis protein FlhA